MPKNALPRTQRELLESGRAGGFRTALFRYHEDPTIPNLMNAYCLADSENRAAMEAASPGLGEFHEAWLRSRNFDPPTPQDLAERFEFLRRLDEDTDNPHEIPLRG